MTYAEKLLDPKWQKKRLQVLERENFTCQYCGDENTTLHVHHEQYNKEPWDAKVSDLKCLCKHCHASCEIVKKMFNGFLILKCIKQEIEDRNYIIHVLLKTHKKESPHLIICEYDENSNKASYSSGVRSDELLQIANLIHIING